VKVIPLCPLAVASVDLGRAGELIEAGHQAPAGWLESPHHHHGPKEEPVA
jgi:hypothetical protein